MLISKQGSDIASNSTGTFSNEDGGIIKAYNNYIEGAFSYLPYNSVSNAIQFDAYEVKNRNEIINDNIKALKGNSTYNNFDTNSSFYVKNLIVENPDLAKENVMKYAGRVEGGDIKFTFDNSVDDQSSSINQTLMNLLKNYKSSLVSIQGIESSPASTDILNIPSNNEQTVLVNTSIQPIEFTWDGTATDVEVIGLPENGIVYQKNNNTKTIVISGTPTADVNFSLKTIGSGTLVHATGSITIEDESTINNSEIHNFTTNGITSKFYTFSGATNINSTDGNATYDELTFTKRLKIESATTISYTTKKKSELTLVFDTTFNGKIKFNGVNYTAKNGIVVISDIADGEHKITKGDTTNLYYIKSTFEEETTLTSKENLLNNTEVSIYPNPVTDKVNVKVSDNSIIRKIRILSIDGRIVKTIENSLSIDVKNINSGIYILQIETNNNIISKKIIKK